MHRYNQLQKVLGDARGRCGEYSMVFYHLMRALGYHTRWVCDWTDHVCKSLSMLLASVYKPRTSVQWNTIHDWHTRCWALQIVAVCCNVRDKVSCSDL